MSLELCILGSGSSGNCSVLRAPGGVMLIDAGLGPRTVTKRLNGTGVRIDDVRAICLTHLDSDHFTPHWVDTILKRGIRVFCHSQRMNRLLDICCADPDERRGAHHTRDEIRAAIEPFGGSTFSPIDGLSIHALPLAHDKTGSHGFVIAGHGCRIGFATDLGHVPPVLIERFAQDIDVLALESNYDPHMQMESPRPFFLKDRITGGRGHLSNEQAFEAIREILDRCERQSRRLPEHIVLLHRSRQCNCPKLVRQLFTQDPRVAERLVLAEHAHRTDWLRPSSVRPSTGEQLVLGFA